VCVCAAPELNLLLCRQLTAQEFVAMPLQPLVDALHSSCRSARIIALRLLIRVFPTGISAMPIAQFDLNQFDLYTVLIRTIASDSLPLRWTSLLSRATPHSAHEHSELYTLANDHILAETELAAALELLASLLANSVTKLVMAPAHDSALAPSCSSNSGSSGSSNRSSSSPTVATATAAATSSLASAGSSPSASSFGVSGTTTMGYPLRKGELRRRLRGVRAVTVALGGPSPAAVHSPPKHTRVRSVEEMVTDDTVLARASYLLRASQRQIRFQSARLFSALSSCQLYRSTVYRHAFAPLVSALCGCDPYTSTANANEAAIEKCVSVE
jgi:hypothetical protein